jgi:hypothetical protein
MKTRNEMIKEMTCYELGFLIDHTEHLSDIADFFIQGGYSTFSDENLLRLYNETYVDA